MTKTRKKAISVLIAISVIITMMPMFAVTAEANSLSEYTLRNEHFIFDESLHGFLVGNISPQVFNIFMERMDLIYGDMLELVGQPPIRGDGAMITIRSCNTQVGRQHIRGGLPYICWPTGQIVGILREIQNTNADCWWFAGTAHEIGHLFHCVHDWNFNTEGWASFLAFYVIEKLDGLKEERSIMAHIDGWSIWPDFDAAWKDHFNSDGAIELFVHPLFVNDPNNYKDWDEASFEHGWHVLSEVLHSYLDTPFNNNCNFRKIVDFVERIADVLGMDVYTYLTTRCSTYALAVFEKIKESYSGSGWSFSNGALSVTTNTATTNWRTGRNSYTFRVEDVTEIIIGNGVATIGATTGNGAFQNTSIVSATIPLSVTRINQNAFSENFELTSLTFTNSTPPTFGNNVFQNTPALKTIHVPFGSRTAYQAVPQLAEFDIVESFFAGEDWIFNLDSGILTVATNAGTTAWRTGRSAATFQISDIKEIIIGSGVQAIWGNAFWDTNITSIKIPNGITSIGSNAFRNTGLTTVVIPDTVEYIRDNAFRNTALTSIIIPDRVERIYQEAFRDNLELTSVIIGNGIASISDSTFRNNPKLTSVTIGNSVTSIGASAFRDNPALASITFTSSTPPTLGTNVFQNTPLSTIYVPMGTRAAYEAVPQLAGRNIVEMSPMPGSFSGIGWNFRDGILTITTNAGTTAWRTGRSAATFQISDVTNVVINSSVTSIGNNAFRDTSFTSMIIPDSVTEIGQYAFNQNINLSSVRLPAGITELRLRTFTGAVLESVTIPDGVTHIHDGVFSHNYLLREIYIPMSVVYINEWALIRSHSNNLTIYGHSGSFAEAFANERGFPFVTGQIPQRVAPTITTTMLPNVTVGVVYNQTLQATGNPATFTWNVTAGTLPAGLNLNSSTGEITGTPTTAGSSTFTISASNGVNPNARRRFTINAVLPPVAYIDAIGNVQLRQSVITYTGQTTLSSGWYLVSGTQTPSSRIVVNGDVHIILEDGAHLDASNGGIRVENTNSLTIYAQSIGGDMGSLTASGGGTWANGIGGGNGEGTSGNGGNVTINGGNIIARGGNAASGIGGGMGGLTNTAGTFTMNGGIVNATGGNNAPGIGGATEGRAGGVTIINGGHLIATGTGGGAGIGGGNAGAGGTITINGGTIEATAGTTGSPAAIGRGAGGAGETVIVNGDFNFITNTTRTNPVASRDSGTVTFDGIVGGINGRNLNTLRYISLIFQEPVAPTITTAPTLSGGTVGVAYNQTLQATGHPSIFIWTTAGDLPPGLNLNSSGAITGTPTTAGTFNFTVSVSNGVNPSATKEFIINIATATEFSGSGWHFSSVSGTLTVNTNAGTTNWRTERGTDFQILDVKEVIIGSGVQAIWGEAFWGTSITSIEIPNGITSIGSSTFRDTGLTSVLIPDSVEYIRDNAFRNTSLTSVVIPDSVERIYWEAFMDNAELTSVTIGNGITNISGSTFRNNPKLTSVTIGNNVTSIGDNAFNNVGLTSIIIPNSVINIGESAFWNNPALTSIIIGDGVVDIGNWAFANDWTLTPALTSVTIGKNVESIGLRVFSNAGLTSVVIPDSVTSIGQSAFWGNVALTSATISNNVKTIDKWAFETTGLTLIIIPDSVTSIGQAAFFDNFALKSVTIGSGVTHIGNYAFEECTALEFITFKSSTPPEFGIEVFWDTPALTTIYVPVGSKASYQTVPQLVGFDIVEIACWLCYDKGCALCPAAPSITTITLPDVTVGAAYNQTLQATGNPATFTWSVTIGSLPEGLNLNPSTGAITGIPTTTGTSNFTVSASNGVGTNATRLLTINIVPAPASPTIITTTLPSGTVGVAYNQTLQATGNPETFAWSVIIGNLPEGLSLNSSTGAITGTPTIAGSIGFTINVSNGVGSNAIMQFSINIVPASAAPTITTTMLSGGTVNVAYNQTLQATGNPATFTWNVTAGTLPAGLNLNSSTGAITGTPTTVGSSTFTIGASNGVDSDATREFSINIIPASTAPIFSGSGWSFQGGTLTVTTNAGTTNWRTGRGLATFQFTDVTAVVIEDDVTSIGGNAFLDCTNLKSVTFKSPSSVTSIGDAAFRRCTSLASITIPDSVTSIGQDVFWHCQNLLEIIVSESNPNFSNDENGVLFNKDKTTLIQYPIGKLQTSYTIPNSVINIGDRAFGGCASLTSVIIGNSVTSIGNNAFTNTGLTSVTIPDSVTSIGNSAFSNCAHLGSVTFQSSSRVTSIGDFAFSYSGLTSIIIPDSVIIIGVSAFSNSRITSVTIGNGVTNINNGAFRDCTSLVSVIFQSPSNALIIEDNAFRDCTNLSSIIIPDSVTSIGESALNGTAWLNNQPNGVVYAGKVAYTYKGEMPPEASIILNEGTRGIATRAFASQISLTSIEIPNSVTSIGVWAFQGCTSLVSITIPGDVKNIGNFAFWGCTSLTSIALKGVTPPSFGYNVFFNTPSLTTICVPGGTQTAYKTAFVGQISSSVEIIENCDICTHCKQTKDNADITAAKTAVENASYTAAQANAANITQAKAAVEAIIGNLSLNGVTATVVDGIFTAAQTGTHNNLSGTNGSYTFTVNLNKGAGTQQTTITLTLTITATPAATYLVTVNNGSGGGNFAEGATVIIAADTAPTGQVFSHWTSSPTITFANNVGASTSFTMPSQAVTVTANFVPLNYSVAFNANSGKGSMNNQSFTYGTAQNLTTNAFTRTGYIFVGWAASSGGDVVYADGASVNNLTAIHNATVNLYAVWVVAPLIGTATINNTSPVFGDTLTGSLVGGNNTGMLTFTWKADGAEVGTGTAYTITAADVGRIITLEITSSVQTGTITSNPTTAVAKANQTAPALNYTIDGNIIVITPVTGAQYRFNSGAWSDTNTHTFTTGDVVALYIRFAETTTHNISLEATMMIDTSLSTPEAPAAFTLTYQANGEINYTVTIPEIAGAEYSFDGTTWSGTRTTIALPGETVTGYARIASVPGVSNPSGVTSVYVVLPLFVMPPDCEYCDDVGCCECDCKCPIFDCELCEDEGCCECDCNCPTFNCELCEDEGCCECDCKCPTFNCELCEDEGCCECDCQCPTFDCELCKDEGCCECDCQCPTFNCELCEDEGCCECDCKCPIISQTPTITIQPTGTTYNRNATATPLTVSASVTDDGILTYQWFRNIANNNTGGTAIEGATNANFTPSTATTGTVYYYVIITNTNGEKEAASITSNVATIIVNAPSGGSSSGGGGGGGGSGGSTPPADNTAPTNPTVTITIGTSAWTVTNIPQVALTNLGLSSSIPIKQVSVPTGATGNISLSVGTDFAGQNVVLVKYNADTEELEFVSAATVGTNGNATVNVTTGDFLILTFKTGDVTGTGEVQTTDALAVLRHVAGISELNSIQQFVANGKEGDVGTNDALNILRYVAGIIDRI
jgi:hypothetical protein